MFFLNSGRNVCITFLSHVVLVLVLVEIVVDNIAFAKLALETRHSTAFVLSSVGSSQPSRGHD
jgi:uncharacterized membrane protein (UPF0182 family)